MIKTQFTLYMSNKPGELARITKAFTAAGINIEGISVAETTHVSLVQIIVSNARLARQVLRKAATPFSVQEVAILILPDEPGALAAVAGKLAKQRININYLYATTPPHRSGGECAVVISTDDLAEVEKI